MSNTTQNPQIPQEKLDEMLNTASKHLGEKPEDLKEKFGKESVDKIMKGLKPEDASKIQKVLSNPELTRKIMSSPQAQALMKQLSGKK